MRIFAGRTAAISLLLAGSATAADIRMPVKAPPPVAVTVANWTGCYVGAGGGVGMFVQRSRDFNNGFIDSPYYNNAGHGWFGTVQVGCDYQAGANIVVGAFADYDFSAIKGDMTAGLSVGQETLRSSWAAGGRIGWLARPNLLVFASAGYTQARFGQVDLVRSVNGLSDGLSLGKHTYSGWFVGSGYEYGLNWLPGLFWKTEYRFADYGTERLPLLDLGVPSPSATIDSHKYVHTVRSELVWRFNAGGAATATASLPVKAPRAAPAAYSWTGCHVGAGGGYGMFEQRVRTINGLAPDAQSNDTGGRGWFGTVQTGCDYQVGATIVIGAAVDYDFSGIKGDTVVASFGTFGAEKLTSSWAVGGRFGWLPSQALLVFVSAGYTEARFGRVDFVGGDASPTGLHLPKNTYAGWYLGAGYEYGLNWLPGLFWKTEYRFADYGTDRLPVIDTATGAPTATSVDSHKYTHTVRSQLVWRFSMGGPVTARY